MARVLVLVGIFSGLWVGVASDAMHGLIVAVLLPVGLVVVARLLGEYATRKL